MNKFLLPLLALASSLSLAAQVVEVKSIEQVPVDDNFNVTLARISPDGTFAIASSAGTSALSRVDLKSGATKVVTNNGSALNLVFSNDGKAIAFKRSITAKNKLRYHSIETVNLETGANISMTTPMRHAGSFGVTPSGNFAVSSEGKLMARNVRGQKVANEGAYTVGVHRGHLELTKPDGTIVNLDPQGKGSYLWPSISPDGTKITYYKVNEGCFVCDIDGKNAKPLGYIHGPAWLGNNAIVGYQDYNNGEVTTASAIVASTLDGKMQTLTDSAILGVEPTASADASKILFSTEDGKLYVINLK